MIFDANIAWANTDYCPQIEKRMLVLKVSQCMYILHWFGNGNSLFKIETKRKFQSKKTLYIKKASALKATMENTQNEMKINLKLILCVVFLSSTSL